MKKTAAKKKPSLDQQMKRLNSKITRINKNIKLGKLPVKMERPGVGTGVYIRKNGKLLLGKRKGGTGAGTWCAPGGKLDMFEVWEDCARRETLEEAGIEVMNLQFVGVVDDPHPEQGSHYVTLSYVADWGSGEPTVMEPDKFEEWGWFSWDDLPEPLFLPVRNFIKTGYNPFTL